MSIKNLFFPKPIANWDEATKLNVEIRCRRLQSTDKFIGNILSVGLIAVTLRSCYMIYKDKPIARQIYPILILSALIMVINRVFSRLHRVNSLEARGYRPPAPPAADPKNPLPQPAPVKPVAKPAPNPPANPVEEKNAAATSVVDAPPSPPAAAAKPAATLVVDFPAAAFLAPAADAQSGNPAETISVSDIPVPALFASAPASDAKPAAKAELDEEELSATPTHAAAALENAATGKPKPAAAEAPLPKLGPLVLKPKALALFDIEALKTTGFTTLDLLGVSDSPGIASETSSVPSSPAPSSAAETPATPNNDISEGSVSMESTPATPATPATPTASGAIATDAAASRQTTSLNRLDL